MSPYNWLWYQLEEILSGAAHIPHHLNAILHGQEAIGKPEVDSRNTSSQAHWQPPVRKDLVIESLDQLVELQTVIFNTEKRIIDEDLKIQGPIAVAGDMQCLGMIVMKKFQHAGGQAKQLQEIMGEVGSKLDLHCTISSQDTTRAAPPINHDHLDAKGLKDLEQVVIRLHNEIFKVEGLMLKDKVEKEGLTTAVEEVHEAGRQIVKEYLTRQKANETGYLNA